MADSYRQHLPTLDLAIERDTERTPDKRQYHVFHNGELVGSHKKLFHAQAQFKKLRDESGWTPPKPEDNLSTSGKLARERELHQRTAYADFWSRSHKFRGGRSPKR